jgi:glycosyltransferase involved in cell wall biosynthesis
MQGEGMSRVTLIDRTDKPLFLVPGGDESNEYYRAVLPAVMVGGAVRHTVEVSRDGGPFEKFSFHRESDLSRVVNSGSAVFKGLGRLTIIASRRVSAVPNVFRLIHLINSEHPGSLWLEHDDYMCERQFMELTMQQRGCADFIALHSVRQLQYAFFHSASHHIVATEPLRAAVLRHNPEAVVSIGPNAIHLGDFPREPREPGLPVRVGYAATNLHAQDMPLVIDGLVSVGLAGAEIGFLGWHPRWEEFGALPGRYRFRGIEYHYGGYAVGLQEFHRRINVFDVAIAPLVDCEYNRCKSPQKWYEHALHRTPMVVSDLPVYSCVEHGVTGFKARNAGEFTEYLKLLCADAELRQRMGQAAHDAVVTRHTTEQYAAQWRTAVASAAAGAATPLPEARGAVLANAGAGGGGFTF